MEDVTGKRHDTPTFTMVRKTMRMTKAAASGGWDGETSGMLMRRCSALWLIDFMRGLLLLFMFTMVGARVTALLLLLAACIAAGGRSCIVPTYVVSSAMSASTKEFRDRDHVVDKYLHTIHTYIHLQDRLCTTMGLCQGSQRALPAIRTVRSYQNQK